MFTAQQVNNNDEDDSHPINAHFENEAQIKQKMTSHDLGNPVDLEHVEGHTLEHIESHCPQSLSQPNVTSVQGSYVSLLADIATIEQTDEYSAQPIAQDISDTVDYATTTFTGQDLTPLQNENMVSYQSIENSNIGYSLSNAVENTQGIQQYVIIQPFLGDTSVNNPSTFIHLPNSAENLDSNKELEDAVANITDSAVAGDTGVVTTEAGATTDESYVVCTNSRGEVKEIQVIQGQPTWTENDVNVPNKRRGRLRSGNRKRRKGVISERKESSLHLKKFSLDDLSSGGKSKKEVFEEFLEKSKDQIRIDSLDTNVVERLQDIQRDNKGDIVHFNEDCSEDIDEGSKEVKCFEELDKNKSAKTETEILRNRHTSDKLFKNHGKLSKSKEYKDLDSETSSSVKENNFTKLKKKNMNVKRKISAPYLEQSSKVAKLDVLHVEELTEQEENKALDNDIESRMMNDFCKLFRSDELCVLHLKPITLKLSRPNRVISIEMEIEKDFVVSTMEKGETTDGFTKYSMKLTAPENALITNTEETNDSKTDKKEVGKTRKLKCPKRSRLKGKRAILKGSKIISGENIKKPLLREDVQENIEVPTIDLDNKDKVAMSEVDNSVNIGIEDDENEEDIKTEINEFGAPDDSDINNKNDINNEKGEVNGNTCNEESTIADGNVIDSEVNDGKATDSNCKKRKTRNVTGKKNKKANQNSNGEKKEESAQNYTVMITEEGIPMYGCPVCGYTSKYRQNAKKHIYEHTATKDFICEICGQSFKSNNRLQKHKIVHQLDRPFPCPLCPQKFKSKKMFQCNVCGKEMSIKQNMDVHINQHTGERPWQCEVCGLGFRGPSNLKAHMNQHDEELRYSCNICSRKFRDRGTYRQHYKRHLGEKKHVCEHCGKSFVITSDLKKHIRIHTGEKPYKCTTCDQQFSDGSSLARHEKMHAAKFRYECGACYRQYSRKDLCKKHIKKTHFNASDIEINEINIIDDLKQVPRDIKVKNQNSLVTKTQKVTGKNINREHSTNPKVKKLKKSWQNLTEEASKRYKEQSSDIIPGASFYREFPNTVVPTYNIDYQTLPAFYGNFNQKYSDNQKPLVSSYSGQEILPPPGPLVFQPFIRNLADSDV